MATAGIVDGSLLRIKIGSSVVAYATVSNYSRTRNVEERIHKDLTDGQTEKSLKEATGTVSIEGFYSEDATNNSPETLETAFANKTSLSVEFTTGVTGDSIRSFNAFISSIEINAEAQQDVTFSATLEIDGGVTIATVA